MSEMIERVAYAIERVRQHDESPIAAALAALEAMREPTEAMRETGANGVCGIIQGVGEKSEKYFVRIWQAAIDAALDDKKTGP